MLVTIFLGIFCVFFSYLAKYKNGEWGLNISFIFIYFFLALRYNFGNDYSNYLKIFENSSNIEDYSFDDIFSFFYEPGWILLNYVFHSLGFFTMNIFIAFFSCLVYFRFIKKYVKREYYWLALFIYIFFPGFLLIQSSAMRQAVAVMIFVYSIDFLVEKRFINYLLMILIASMFHYSSLFLLPVYLLVYFNGKIRLLSIIFLLLGYLSLFTMGETLAPFFQSLMLSISDKYESYVDQGKISSGLGFIYFTLLFLVVLIYESRNTEKVRMIFKISILSFFIIPLGIIIEMSGRFTLYLAPSTIVVYPSIAESMNNSYKKYFFLIAIVVFTLFQFFTFFYSKTYYEYFFEYKTIFSANKWY